MCWKTDYRGSGDREKITVHLYLVDQAALDCKPGHFACAAVKNQRQLTVRDAALTSFLKSFSQASKTAAQLTDAFNPGHTRHLCISWNGHRSGSEQQEQQQQQQQQWRRVPQVSYHILSQVTPEFPCSSVATRKTHKTDKKLCCPNYHWAFCQQASTCPSIWIIHP